MQPAEFENELTLLTHRQNGDEDEFHETEEEAIESVEADLVEYHALCIDGDRVETDDRFEVTSPGDVPPGTSVNTFTEPSSLA